MLSRFFVARPIFASVISILIVVAGSIALFSLPISRYPNITPPMVQVTASYPGADPQVVADTVASPIEQEVNGVEKMLYMSSTSASDGSYTLKITFELGTDVDTATVLVQNRLSSRDAAIASGSPEARNKHQEIFYDLCGCIFLIFFGWEV